MLVSVLVAVGLASRITHPVEVLTAGAKDIAEGHFDRHLDIRSNDELQILAETFNHMTDRLRRTSSSSRSPTRSWPRSTRS